jgi:hypothetical protein
VSSWVDSTNLSPVARRCSYSADRVPLWSTCRYEHVETDALSIQQHWWQVCCHTGCPCGPLQQMNSSRTTMFGLRVCCPALSSAGRHSAGRHSLWAGAAHTGQTECPCGPPDSCKPQDSVLMFVMFVSTTEYALWVEQLAAIQCRQSALVVHLQQQQERWNA